jgi:hypothetical protein
MPADMAAYKGIAAMRAPLLAWLERRAAADSKADAISSS